MHGTWPKHESLYVKMTLHMIWVQRNERVRAWGQLNRMTWAWYLDLV